MVAQLHFTKTNLILGQSQGKSDVVHGLPESASVAQPRLIRSARFVVIKPVGAQLPPWLFIELESFGSGTQNQTGVHGFADTLMISNSIFFNE
jgi:hypothetical protein